MPAVKFGVVIPYGSARQAAELAHIAEDTGWEGVFVGDAIWTEDPLIRLTAAAMTTRRIKLGTMVLPAPLRFPWALASQSLALDILSEGRLILGLGTGATYMGWHAFPGVVTDTRARAEMLDETIDILTQMFQCKQFDYHGKHFQVALSALDPQYYPPASLQQPRVPIWVPGVWRKKKSMQRVLKCDGIFPTKMDAEGKFVEFTPADLSEMKAYISANRAQDTPFDMVVEGRTGDMERSQAQEKISEWTGSGMTWWIESTWMDNEEQLAARIRQGPPR
jgi:hypothetical protein